MITCFFKNAVSSTSTVIFEGDPSGSPNKTYMAEIIDRNYTT